MFHTDPSVISHTILCRHPPVETHGVRLRDVRSIKTRCASNKEKKLIGIVSQ